MAGCSAKNRECAGGSKWCIGGSLVFEPGSKLIINEGAEIPEGFGGGGGAGAVSWDDLDNKPFYEEEGEVDIVPEQVVTFVDGAAQFGGFKDPCYTLGLVTDPGTMTATLVIDGEVIEGEINYYYASTGTFGAYTVHSDCITLGEGATVQDGATVKVRVYAKSTILVPLPEKFLPKNVPVIQSGDDVTDTTIAVPIFGSGGIKGYRNLNLDRYIPAQSASCQLPWLKGEEVEDVSQVVFEAVGELSKYRLDVSNFTSSDGNSFGLSLVGTDGITSHSISVDLGTDSDACVILEKLTGGWYEATILTPSKVEHQPLRTLGMVVNLRVFRGVAGVTLGGTFELYGV